MTKLMMLKLKMHRHLKQVNEMYYKIQVRPIKWSVDRNDE